MSFTPLSCHGLWLAEMIAAGAPARCARNAIAGVGATPSATTLAPSAREPAREVGFDPRARLARVAPDEERLGSEHPRRGPAERDDSGEVRSASASPRTPSVPNRSTRGVGAYRFEYCGALRAFLRPYLRRSFSRASRASKPGLLQHRPRVGVERDQRPGDAEPDRAGLAAHAAAVERRVDVVDLFGLREPQRLLGDDLVREDREVRLELAPVDQDLPAAVPDPHAGDRFLATTGRLDQRLGQERSLLAVTPSPARVERAGNSWTTGFCAECGCVAPP